MDDKNNNRLQGESATLGRRLGAGLYDGILLFAVYILAGLAVSHWTNAEPSFLYHLYLWLVGFAYFAWPWTRHGQTLGMRTWRLYFVDDAGLKMRWWQALLRYIALCLLWFCLALGVYATWIEVNLFLSATAWLCFGFSLLWALVDKQKRTWQDIASKTRLIRLLDIS
jgi:uncharacterized RDD family membrane protein YckC